MKKNRLFTTICLMVAILFTACTQDELTEQGAALPDGEYPLQIGSVSITAEASEEPWTRVSEKPDGSGSVFQNGDRIGVRIAGSDETGIYVINADADGNITSITPDKPVYWQSTQTAEVTAWYPAEASSVNLGFQLQNNTMTYVLRGTGTGNHQSPVTLKFEHQLAKVRVVAKGTAEVRNISIQHVPRICYIDEGKITGLDNISTGGIPMLPVEREGIGTCWEASVGPGIEIQKFNIDAMDCDLTSSVTTQAGALHTITITANSEGTQTIDLSNSDYEINDDRTYYFSGTASHAIRVTGGSPNIYLEDAEISVSSGPAIDIQGGNPTIHIKGNDNEVSSSDGAGIYVAENSTVTIQGNSTEDALTCEGNNLSASIGGYMSGNTAYPCGNIVIDNVTLTARSNQTSTTGDYAAGIGAVSNARVGSISISDAIIYADGGGDNSTMGAAAIGGGIDYLNLSGQTEFDITISNSTIHATRGCSYASYIGAGGWHGGTAGYNIISTANITGSIIYDESGTEITQ